MNDSLPDEKHVADVLRFDPLDAAERATGKHWQESDVTGLLGMALAMEHGRHKEEVLTRFDDTHMSQKLDA